MPQFAKSVSCEWLHLVNVKIVYQKQTPVTTLKLVQFKVGVVLVLRIYSLVIVSYAAQWLQIVNHLTIKLSNDSNFRPC